MLPARYRLTTHAGITDTIRRGGRARSGGLVVHFVSGHTSARDGDPDVKPESSSDLAVPRAAFAVSRAVGNSTVRHRVVRRIRAFLPPILDALPAGSRLVIRALPEAAGESSEHLRRDLVRALGKLGVSEPPASEPVPDLAITAPIPAPREGAARVTWVLGAPVRLLLLSVIWVYRHTFSLILPPTCRYYPSCSAFALGALQTHGAAKGSVLAGWRLLRCNPFTPGGLDPVPARGEWRPVIHPDGTPRVESGTSA